MAQYVIYKYEFASIGTKSLFQPSGERASIDTPESVSEYFGRELAKRDKLNLYRTKKTGEPTVYPNDIIRSCGGVTVMRVCNVKHVKLVHQYQERMEETNPWCNVIIDARPDVAQIAIERSGAFGGNTDKVRDILQESLHAALSPLGFTVEIRAKMRAAGFWEMVERRVFEQKDTVKRVVFDFSDPHTAGPVDAEPSVIERLSLIASLTRSMGAAKASLRMEAVKEGTLLLDRTKEDLAQMVSLCCNNGYDISVHFRQMGVYRFGNRAHAVYDIEEKLINDFNNGQAVLGKAEDETAYALIDKLDDIREQTKGYEDAKKIDNRGKRKHRRAV